jgi:hypothetical protein
MKKYSIVRVGDEYVVRAGETSILKVSSQQVTDAAELLQQQPDPAAEEEPSTSEQLRDDGRIPGAITSPLGIPDATELP